MLLITCPVCRISTDETEFVHGGVVPPAHPASSVVPRGVIRELWRCAAGCGTWFVAARHTVSQRIIETERLTTPGSRA
jgi:sarcosine oxidase subunit delta